MSIRTADRSAGVTAAAVVVFLGSAFTVLLAVIVAASLIFWKALPTGPPGSSPPFGFRQSMMGAIVLYLGLSLAGFATGVGLLRLKAWARVSILLFSALMLLGFGAGALTILLIPALLQGTPGGPPPGMIQAVILMIMGIPALVALWWLIYFSLKSVRQQFEEHPISGQYSRDEAAARTLFLGPQRPLSITLIALMYLLSLPFLLMTAFSDYPVLLFGALVTGSPARAGYVTYILVGAWVGYGLLKLKPAARLVAIGLTFLHLANTLWMFARPGSEEIMQKLFEASHIELPPQITASSLETMISIGTVFGLVFSLAVLWFLVSNKSAFEEQKPQPS